VKVGLKDGIKLYLNEAEDTWIVIRPSGTEPLVRLYAESPSAALADGMLTDCQFQVEAILKDLKADESMVQERQPIKI
jgi:phosphomannomutase